MQKVTLRGKFNDKGLKKLHPKSHISRNKIIIKDDPNLDFMKALVLNTNSSIKLDYSEFRIIDFRLEGKIDDWNFEIDIETW